MRNFLARSIVSIARLSTLLLAPQRRADVFAQVRSTLPRKRVAIDTDLGRLFFRHGAGQSRVMPFRLFEQDTAGWIRAMPDNACLWDIGANVGVYSLYASLKPGVRVVAFEPAAANFAAFDENIQCNAKSDQIKAYCAALAGQSRLDVLNMEEVCAGAWRLGFGTETNQFDEAIDVQHRQGAIGFAIDSFVSMFDPPLPTHVKIDVDGTEAQIIRGGRELLSSPAVQSMIVEIEGDLRSPRNQEIIGLVTELGFVSRDKASPQLRNVIFDRPA